MKRSRTLKLTLMAGALPIALTACDNTPTGVVVRSVQECMGLGHPQVDCMQAEARARAEHLRTAPRFADEQQCRIEFGDCGAQTVDSRSMFLPVMSGFLISYVQQQRSGGGGGGGSFLLRGGNPLYTLRGSNEFLRADGSYVGNRIGTVTGARGAEIRPARAITVERGGFGSRSAAASAFGGRGGRGG